MGNFAHAINISFSLILQIKIGSLQVVQWSTKSTEYAEAVIIAAGTEKEMHQHLKQSSPELPPRPAVEKRTKAVNKVINTLQCYCCSIVVTYWCSLVHKYLYV